MQDFRLMSSTWTKESGNSELFDCRLKTTPCSSIEKLIYPQVHLSETKNEQNSGAVQSFLKNKYLTKLLFTNSVNQF